MNTSYQIEIEESAKLRGASATIRNGAIQVRLPQRWSRKIKQEVTEDLVRRIQAKDAKERKLLDKVASAQRRITIRTNEELTAYVRQLNRETFNYPRLGKIQIGWSRYHHLAQVNLGTWTMTVSRFCLENAPAEALRYLIVHELAHYQEAGHNKRFWNLVARHVPDHALQSRVIKAFHHQAVMAEEAAEKQQAETVAASELDNLEYLDLKAQEKLERERLERLWLERQEQEAHPDGIHWDPDHDLSITMDEFLDPVYEPDFEGGGYETDSGDFSASPEITGGYGDWTPDDEDVAVEMTTPVQPVVIPAQKKSGPSGEDKPGFFQQIKQLLLWDSK